MEGQREALKNMSDEWQYKIEDEEERLKNLK
jgi:hypothetical protein